MKKLLYQIHRWVGVALALFMTLWFGSGLAIFYAPSTVLSPSQQWAHREAVQPEPGWLSLGQVWDRSTSSRLDPQTGKDVPPLPADARLVRQAGNAYWLVEDTLGKRWALSARDGSLHTTDAAEATRIAQQWLRHDAEAAGQTVRHLDTGPQDSASRNLDALRPLHRLAVGDSGRELLVSARTGEVVRDSTRFDRALYWAGNYVHLLRPLDTFGLGAWRRDVLMWLAFFAFAGSVTGLIIGWQRWRPGWGGRPTYSQGRKHPYRDAWNTWHFWTGLIGGTAALLWSFSGFFNGNPFQVFSPATPPRAALSQWLGPEVPAAMRDWQPASASSGTPTDTVELVWRRLGGTANLTAVQRNGERLTLTATHNEVGHLDERTLHEAAARLAGPEVALTAITLQREHDAWYYPRENQGAYERPLPVLRVELDDDAATRLYLDPQDGRLLLRQDTSRRVYRVIWTALHHWDFGWLAHGLVRDAWMLTWISLGLVLAVTSVWLGWLRLKRTVAPGKKAAAKQKAGATSTSPAVARPAGALPNA